MVNTKGMVRRSTYEDVLREVNADTFKDYWHTPNRNAKFYLQSPEMVALDPENEEDIVRFEKNKRRERLVKKYAAKRAELKARAKDSSLSVEENFDARLALAKLPRNSAATRVRLRCELSGRPRGNYRKFKLSRIAFRDLASQGQVPGVVKSSW